MDVDCGQAPVNAISPSMDESCFNATGYLFSLLALPPSAGEISRMCGNSACMSIYNAIRKAAPSECWIETTKVPRLLYADFLNPISAVCIRTPTPAPAPVTTPRAPVTTSPAPVTTPPAPVTTPPAPVSTTPAPVPTTPTPSDPILPPLVPSTTSTTGSSVTIAMVGGASAVVVVVALIIMFVVLRKRRAKESRDDAEVYTMTIDTSRSNDDRISHAVRGRHRAHEAAAPKASGSSITEQSTSSSSSSNGGALTYAVTNAAIVALLNDRVIEEAYVPSEEVFIGDVVGQGAYGEVLRGRYDSINVAIKRLIPARRRDAKQIASFLEEAKLLAMLDHPRVVDFLGVSWRHGADSLESLCILSEFMDGGDLRSMLEYADSMNEPMGFTSEKLNIATHIADALVYLHGLASPVVHRDLKSMNVLLSREGDAKITDFGIARGLVDVTMTAGVGTYLWMAPEVIFSKRYDEKADIYSLGVVLAELDTQKLLYAYAAQAHANNAYSRPTELSILTAVSTGCGRNDRALLERLVSCITSPHVEPI